MLNLTWTGGRRTGERGIGGNSTYSFTHLFFSFQIVKAKVKPPYLLRFLEG